MPSVKDSSAVTPAFCWGWTRRPLRSLPNLQFNDLINNASKVARVTHPCSSSRRDFQPSPTGTPTLQFLSCCFFVSPKCIAGEGKLHPFLPYTCERHPGRDTAFSLLCCSFYLNLHKSLSIFFTAVVMSLSRRWIANENRGLGLHSSQSLFHTSLQWTIAPITGPGCLSSLVFLSSHSFHHIHVALQNSLPGPWNSP